MRFARRPFVYLTALLLTGVIIGDLLYLEVQLVASSLLFLFILAIAANKWIKQKLVAEISLFICIVLLGTLAMHIERSDAFVPGSTISEKGYLVLINEIAPNTNEWRKAICTIENENERGKVLLFIKDDRAKTGDILYIHTKLEPIRNKGNPGEFDAELYWSSKNIFCIGFISKTDLKYIDHVPESWYSQVFGTIREKLGEVLDAHLEGTNLSIASALLLGDKSLLSTEERNTFSNAGAMHVLAVSGLHVGIILYLLIFILSRFPRFISKSTASIIAVLVIWLYAATTGMSPSVMRASFMFTVLVLGQVLGKQMDSVNSLFFSAFILLLFNPLLIYDIGFQLSYLAMFGILTLYGRIERLIYIPNKMLCKVWQGTAVGLAAQAFTIPLTLYYFHQFPNYFVLSNLVVMVFAGLILGVGMALFALHKMWILNKLIGITLGFLITGLFVSLSWIQDLPGAVAYGFNISVDLLILMYIGLVSLMLTLKLKRLRIGVIVVLLLLFGLVEFNRYSDSTLDQIVIFNSNTPVIAIKQKDEIICLHENEERQKAEFIIHAYQKTHPGKVSYEILPENKLTIKGSEFIQLERFENGLVIKTNDKNYFLKTGYGEDQFEDVSRIDMPYLESEINLSNLNNGARIIFL